MEIICYTPEGGESGLRLREVIERKLPGLVRVCCRNAAELREVLHAPGGRDRVAVVMVNSNSALDGLHEMAEVFTRHRLILLLPDRRPETVARGHRLRPRFLGFADSDISNVGSILCHMRDRLESQN